MEKARSDEEFKLESKKLDLDNENNSKIQEEKNLIENKKNEDISKIRKNEEQRQKAELSLLEKTLTEIDSKKYEELHTDLLKNFQQKLSEAEKTIDQEYKHDLENFQEKLTVEKGIFAKETENKIKSELANELANKQNHKDAMQKAFLSKKNAINEKFNMEKTAIEKEYDIKTRLLPEAKLLESEKLRAELKYQELLRDIKGQLNKTISSQIKENENEEKTKVLLNDNELNSKKQEYSKEAEEKIAKITDELQQNKNLIKELIQIAGDTRKTQSEIQQTETILAKKGKELEGLGMENAKQIENVQNLENELKNIDENKEKDNEKINQINEINQNIKLLEEELNKKKEEVKILEQNIQEIREKMASIQHEKVSETMKSYNDSLQIENLNEKLEEIKEIISAKKEPKRGLSVAEPKLLLVKEKSVKKAKISTRKLQEIAIFINAEKTKLLLDKKSSLNDYNVSSKLLKSLHHNLNEWNQELSKSRVDEIHEPVLGDLKTNLSHQASVLSKQIEKIKKEIVHIENKLSNVTKLENALNRFYSTKSNKDAENLGNRIIEEYESYIRRYENDDLGHNLHSDKKFYATDGFKDNNNFDEEIVSDEELKSNRRPAKGLRQVYKNVLNYNDAMKNMYQRDIIRLTRNRMAVFDLYANEENWLRQMKFQVSKNTYAFH